MKTCTKCGETKTVDEFYNDPRYAGGKFSQCKVCRLAYQREHRRKNPAATHGSWIKWKYGLTLSEYRRLLKEQGGGCAVCGHQPPENGWLHVDHCHVSSRVRGLLCGNCNRALGILQEDAARATALAAYVTERC